MHCMKCGREIPDSQVFCDGCLTVMKAYPVKPDTPVQILKRPARTEKKAAPQTSLKEVVQRQKTTIRWLSLVLVILSIVLCLVCGMLYLQIRANANTLPDEEPGFSQTEPNAGEPT